ncbi:MAG: hypothetical protein U0469_02340 [Candidatus Paceibacterota bacterium]|jgi:uncharacterized protein YaaW (UPF0174 family)
MEGLRKNIKVKITKIPEDYKKSDTENWKEIKNDELDIENNKETKKTEMEKKMIALSGKIIKDWTENNLKLKDIDIPNETDFQNRLPPPFHVASGSYNPEEDVIEIGSLNKIKPFRYLSEILKSDIDNYKKFKKFSTILHEALHYASFNMRRYKEYNNAIISTGDMVGYEVGHEDEDGYMSYFKALNEAITEFIKDEIIKRNFDEIQKELKIKNTLGIRKDLFIKLKLILSKSYSKEIYLINKIIKNCNIDKQKLFHDYFTGDIKYLTQKLESVYGPGSTKILASIDKMNGISDLDKQIYFDLNTEEKLRLKIKESIMKNL